MSWEYGTLATEVYELDKPVGCPLADVEYYTGLLADVRDRSWNRQPERAGSSSRSLRQAIR
jgi:hypothetical protein